MTYQNLTSLQAGSGYSRLAEFLHLVASRPTAGMAALDLDGKAFYVNERICLLLGHPQEKILGMPFGRFLEGMEDSVARVKQEGRLERESLLFALDEILPVNLELLDLNGYFADLAGVWVILERPIHFQPEQHSVFGGAAEASNLKVQPSLKGTLNSIVHDLNNILSTISVSSELLEIMTRESSSAHPVLSVIEKSVDRANIINNSIRSIADNSD